MSGIDHKAPFCLCADGLRSRGDLWRDVDAARAMFAGHDAVCNMIGTRYDFAVALLAAMANGQTAVMPPARAEEAVFSAVEGFRDPKMIDRLDLVAAPGHENAEPPAAWPGAAWMFTSGSTGRPVAHVKTWETLAGGSRLTSDLIGRAGLDPARTLVVGTTPTQHMYGMEAALFSGIADGHVIADRAVFFPADLEQIIALATAHGFPDIALVTTPPHLKYLEAEIRRQKAVRCVLSATAPLHADLAARLEDGGVRQVHEIYGSTETGSMAWRRTTGDPAWTLLDGFSLTAVDRGWQACASHLPGPPALADEIDLLPDGRFHLLGRAEDMVRIAGKRHSLGALNAMLATMDEIADAVILRERCALSDELAIFVVPRPEGPADSAGLTRLVRAHMLRHVDPVFVPRSISVVPGLPRNATGKVTLQALQEMIVGDDGNESSAPGLGSSG